MAVIEPPEGGESITVGGGAGGGGTPTRNRGAGEPPADDRATLTELITSVRDLVVSTLERPALLEPHNELFREAWRSVEPRFEILLGAIREGDEADLTAHGLTGSELALKKAVFDEARATFEDRLARIDRSFIWRLFGNPLPRVPIEEPLRAARKVGKVARAVGGGTLAGVKKVARPAFAFGDKAIMSASAAVAMSHPAAGIAGPAIDEFKSAMEAVISRAWGWWKGRREGSDAAVT